MICLLKSGLAMTEDQKIIIRNLRKRGLGYKKISEEMGISVSTIKSFCKRNEIGECPLPKPMNENERLCLYCRGILIQPIGRKEKKFCSDKCRNKWWNSHLDQVKRKAIYHYECPYCKRKFEVYGNAKRKYCCHACYVADRFGGEKS